MTLLSLICWLLGHHWRRLRKGEDVQPLDITPEMAGIGHAALSLRLRICSRCGRTRLAKARKRKAA